MILDPGPMLATHLVSALGGDPKPSLMDVAPPGDESAVTFESLLRRAPSTTSPEDTDARLGSAPESTRPLADGLSLATSPAVTAALTAMALATAIEPSERRAPDGAEPVAEEEIIAATSLGVESATPPYGRGALEPRVSHADPLPISKELIFATNGTTRPPPQAPSADFSHQPPFDVADLLPSIANVREEQTATIAPATLQVTGLETHLPGVLAQHVSEMSSSENVDKTKSVTTFDPAATQRDAPIVKILRFELEPASLGALTVRMRMAQSRVEIAIETQSSEALSRLNELRDRMTGAVAASGCAVDALDLRVATPVSFDMSQPQTNDGRPSNSQDHHAQRQEFSEGGGSQPRGQSQPRTRRDPQAFVDNRDHGASGGVYL